MTNFHEVRFPTDISRGSSGGPRRRTEIVTLRNGFEARNSIWADSRREYDAGLGMRDINDVYQAIEFFEARLGALYGFRWKDWSDFRSGPPNTATTEQDQELGTGDGLETTFQLIKAYTSGAVTYTRSISKPVAGTVSLEVNGSLVDPADYSVDTTTGEVTLDTAPGLGHTVKAGYEFDVPVRFKEDFIDVSVENFNAGQVPQLSLVEVRV